MLFWISHWYLVGTLLIVRESRLSSFDYVLIMSRHNLLDRHAFCLHVGVLSDVVFQQRAAFLYIQVVPQQLITSWDSQQPLALVESPAALPLVSPAASFSRCRVCLHLDHTPCWSPQSRGNSLLLPTSLITYLSLRRRTGTGACSWQADSCAGAAGGGTNSSDQITARHRFLKMSSPGGLFSVIHLWHHRDCLASEHPWPVSEIGTVLGLCV